MKLAVRSSPLVLARAPEMAIVDLLDSAIAIATHALFAANPELESAEFLLELPQPSVRACLADAVLTQLRALEAALHSYGTYVVDHEDHRAEEATADF
jgi:hypothetical protein